LVEKPHQDSSSAWASADNDVHAICTVEVGVDALHTTGDLDGLTVDQHGSKAWMPRRWKRRGAVEHPGVHGDLFEDVHTTGLRRSTMRLALLMFWAICVSISRSYEGLNSSKASSWQTGHWCSLSCDRRR